MAAAAEFQGDMQTAVVTLLARAESLDHGARDLHPAVATAYRRRAAELKLAAWLGALRTAPVPVDTVLHAGRASASAIEAA
jgi:hypothetical protein